MTLLLPQLMLWPFLLSLGDAMQLLPAEEELQPATRRPKGAQFAICDLPQRCGPEYLRSFYIGDLLNHISESAGRVAKKGRAPVILQIGAANLGNTARFSDIDLFTKALSVHPFPQRESVRLVFVEPNVVLHEVFWQNVRRLPIDMKQVQLVTAMIKGKCTENRTSMYRFSRQAEGDFGVPFNLYSTWLGSYRRFPMNALHGFLMGTGRDSSIEQRWLAFANASNLSSYIVEVGTPCFTPRTLLATANVSASDLTMVVVDAEGLDYNIVPGFVRIPGFSPGYLQYEASTWEDEEHYQLLRELRQHGFVVGKSFTDERNHSDCNNAVAVKRGSSNLSHH